VSLSAEESRRISAAVGEKIKNPCALCGASAWGWLPNLVSLPTTPYETASQQPTGKRALLRNITDVASEASGLSAVASHLAYTPPSPSYPLLPVLCHHCGNTLLLNVYTLGIADIWPLVVSERAS
jgi:hypothetical protein